MKSKVKGLAIGWLALCGGINLAIGGFSWPNIYTHTAVIYGKTERMEQDAFWLGGQIVWSGSPSDTEWEWEDYVPARGQPNDVYNAPDVYTPTDFWEGGPPYGASPAVIEKYFLLDFAEM